MTVGSRLAQADPGPIAAVKDQSCWHKASSWALSIGRPGCAFRRCTPPGMGPLLLRPAHSGHHGLARHSEQASQLLVLAFEICSRSMLAPKGLGRTCMRPCMPWPAAAHSVPRGRVPVCRSAASGWTLRSLDRLLHTLESTTGSHGVRCAAYAGFQGGPAAAAGRALLPPLPYGLRSVLKQQQVTPTGASGDCRELPSASPPTPVSHTVPHNPPVAVTRPIAGRRWWASGSAWRQRRRRRRSWRQRQLEPRRRQQQRPPWATSPPSTLATVGAP